MVMPHKVIADLFKNLKTAEFYRSVLGSSLRIIAGFLTGLFLGALLGALSYKVSFFKDILSPFMSVIKAVPVASFVVLLLIWAGSGKLSFFISFLIVLPNVYVSTLSGFESTDKDLLMMAAVYKYDLRERLLFIYRESVLPYVISNLKVTAGLAWKSGVASEVIGLPDHSLGSRIYMSKIYLDTAGLLSYSLVVILLSYIFEKAVLKILNVLLKKEPRYHEKAISPVADDALSSPAGNIEINDISVSFEGKEVLKDISISLGKGKIYALMGPSGEGKTTLLKEIYKRSGLRGTVCFQDEYLIERGSIYLNVAAGENAFSHDKINEEILRLFDEDDKDKRAEELSGGMRRRVSLLRALMHGGELVLLDEPFAGMDEELKKKAIESILRLKGGRTLVLVTHDEEDAKLLNAEIIRMDKINGR